jgi:hypothetical protein
VNFNHPRMRTFCCRYLNAFIGDVRKTLDEVKKKGKSLELSIWIKTNPNWVLDSGMDMEHWIGKG